ncbi:hypothetical protein BKA62DRAFT_716546 [Auriculariales sp. MPI-PUGE-AT-0066]|nr:hypothetical protein BKA62DRAFT_716546 [Auriculariales sp. MPI-PUGE-AT-0066]
MSSTHNSSLGIVPTSADFAPSIIFTIAYIVLLPVAIWRGASRETRCMALIQPVIFVVLRVATWAIRAYLAKAKLSIGLIATETVLVSSATVLLYRLFVAETRKILTNWVPRAAPTSYDRRNQPVHRDSLGIVLRLLDLALMATVIMSIYGATQTGDAINGVQDAIDTLSTLRKASAFVLLGVSGICIGSLLWFSQQHSLPNRAVYVNCVIGLVLAVIAAYRIAVAYRASGSGSAAAFWCALALPEIIVVVIVFSLNLKEFVPENPQKVDYSRQTGVPHSRDTELGQRPFVQG